MSKPRTLLLLFTSFFSACAFLGPFKDLDADGDGVINREEAAENGRLREIFDSADDDKNGVLDEEEYAAAKIILDRYRREDVAQRRSGGGGKAYKH